MSWETQALICAIINHYGKASELKTEYPNLEPFLRRAFGATLVSQ